MALVLPLVLFWWTAVAAQPMQLTPAHVESAALVEEEGPRAAENPVGSKSVTTSSSWATSLGTTAPGPGSTTCSVGNKRFTIIKKSRVATGFSRADYYDWNEAVRDIAAETRIDIAVVVMGTNDRQPIVEKGQRHALFEPGWHEIYERRVDAFTATLQATGARIYWLELPVMRSPRFGGDMAAVQQNLRGTGTHQRRFAKSWEPMVWPRTKPAVTRLMAPTVLAARGCCAPKTAFTSRCLDMNCWASVWRRRCLPMSKPAAHPFVSPKCRRNCAAKPPRRKCLRQNEPSCRNRLSI